MKLVQKSPIPQELLAFQQANSSATWDEMRNINRNADRTCMEQAIIDQSGLCAYCECKISADQPHRCRIEHFHPKADSSQNKNWHLDWQNMLATCNGGESEGSTAEPLPANLSCDAYKNHMITKGALQIQVEQCIFSPLHLPSFPNIFAFDKGTGHLEPDQSACSQTAIDADKLNNTIQMLNLNCERLARLRREIVVNIERNKKKLRQKNIAPQDAPTLLVKRYFGEKWPEFFTTIRCCLGQSAEDYLQSINYQG